nr:type I-E CRISPR-associated endoribonuclease Cas2e [Nitrosomonas nitrosa]
MVVMILERAPAGLKGEITRWLLEPQSGVYVGNVSGTVRDWLWNEVCRKLRGGAALMIHNAANEQGFTMRFTGDTSRTVEDFDGLFLIRKPSEK